MKKHSFILFVFLLAIILLAWVGAVFLLLDLPFFYQMLLLIAGFAMILYFSIYFYFKNFVSTPITSAKESYPAGSSSNISHPALKKMEKFRKEYIGNVSHELKTPIFNIQGYLESMQAMENRNAPLFDNFLKKALQNTERLYTIVKDLEILSQSDSGDLALQFEEFSIRDLIREVFEELEMKARKQEIQLTLQDEFCPDYTVLADRNRIRQVLNNLISNAIDYNKKGGRVTVSCVDKGEKVHIHIADTGIGIKAKHLPRLFERFYRVDKNRSRKKGGSGLGLAIVKHLVEAHGENVFVESTPGEGSVFGFTLKKA